MAITAYETHQETVEGVIGRASLDMDSIATQNEVKTGYNGQIRMSGDALTYSQTHTSSNAITVQKMIPVIAQVLSGLEAGSVPLKTPD